METIRDIKTKIADELSRVLKTLSDDGDSLTIEEFRQPPDIKLGHFSIVMFPFAKVLKSNPQELARRVVDMLNNNVRFKTFASCEAHGPYVNVTVNPEILGNAVLGQVLREIDAFGATQGNKSETIMVEYSAPNTNKPQHLGHLRNNSLGLAAGNLLRSTGATVIFANLVNDRGIHIMKSMLAYQLWGEGKTPQSENVKGDHFVGTYYVMFDKAHKKQIDEMRGLDPERWKNVEANEIKTPLLLQAQELLVKWEAGDSEILALWKTMNDWVLEGFRTTYTRMGAHFDHWYFESNTYTLGRDIVERGLELGVFEKTPDGSVSIDLTDSGFDIKSLLRADGTSLYITQDLGTAVMKFEDFPLTRSIYTVACEQDYHFKVLFKILERLKYPWAKQCYHLSYGMVNLPEGRMKSREGTTVDADDLMDQLFHLAQQQTRERRKDLEQDEIDRIAHMVSLGALKFYLLKPKPQTTMKFDPKETIAISGGTGPYVQYTHARICSILKKTNIELDTINAGLLKQPEEQALILALSKFPEIIAQAAKELNPAVLCEYLLNLSRYFNEFYVKHSVVNADSTDLQVARFALVKSVAITLKNGLALLGIDAPEQM